MKCDICGKRAASVHLTEVINDKVTKLHICEDCAKIKSEEMHAHFGLNDLLSGLVDFVPDVSGSSMKTDVEVKCSGCGMTYYDFHNTGKLGCGHCYKMFEKDLSKLLRKIHGSDRHVGKMPFKGEECLQDQKDLQRLKKELSAMVLAEEFEKAAFLRDRIRDLDEKLGKINEQ